MKKLLINKYYDGLMFMEDIFSALGALVNNHRRKIDDRYWEKYLSKVDTNGKSN